MATLLLAMGVNIRVVQEVLGHSNVSTTLGTYGHVLPGMQENAMKRWGSILEER
jgi:integrase